MSMLNDLKFFLKKYISNPLVLGIVAYLAYRLLRKYVTNKEMFVKENIEEIEEHGNFVIIYDSDSQYYTLFYGDNQILSAKNKQTVINKMQKLMVKK